MDLDARPALIVVDVQAGTLRNLDEAARAPLVEGVASLLDAFRRRALPVVNARVVGAPPGRTDIGRPTSDWPDADVSAPARVAVGPGDIEVRRRTWSVLADPALAERLRLLGVTQVVVTGLASGFGVESTGRSAYDLGFDVVFVSDAIADPRPGAHDALLAGLFRVIGQVATAGEIVALLDARGSAASER